MPCVFLWEICWLIGWSIYIFAKPKSKLKYPILISSIILCPTLSKKICLDVSMQSRPGIHELHIWHLVCFFWYILWSYDTLTPSTGSKWLKTCLLRQCSNLSEALHYVEGIAKLLWSLQFKCASGHTFLEVLIM